MFGRDGEEIARYRKLHLFDVVTPDGREYRESALVGRGQRGGDLPGGGRTGRLLHLLRYTLRRTLPAARRAEGAQLLTVPAAFTLQTGKDHWEILLRARAIETQCFVAAAAQVGSFPAGKDVRQNWGHSMIVDPWGKILTQLAEGPGFATARLDLDYLARVREMLPVAGHRVLPGLAPAEPNRSKHRLTRGLERRSSMIMAARDHRSA